MASPSSSSQRSLYGGKLVLTQGVSSWVNTGYKRYAYEPSNLIPEWRRHCIAVIITSHLNGDQLDTCNEEHALNHETLSRPGEGGQVVSVWDRKDTGKVFCITTDYGGENALTTVMFAEEC